MKIISWNVNSINSRIDHLINFLKKNDIDIILLQELKCINENFPNQKLEKLGYNCFVHGQKAWNGVAILSRVKIDIINKYIPGYEKDNQSRIIESEIKLKNLKNKIKLFCIYLPNGNPIDSNKFEYKLEWMKKFNNYIYKIYSNNIPLIIGGDFNVIPSDDDVYEPKNFLDDACAHPKTRKLYRSLINIGLTDTVKDFINGKSNWTYWGYRAGAWQKGNGLRIDHFLTSPEVTDMIKSVKIDSNPRNWEKPSDHVPVILEIKD